MSPTRLRLDDPCNPPLSSLPFHSAPQGPGFAGWNGYDDNGMKGEQSETETIKDMMVKDMPGYVRPKGYNSSSRMLLDRRFQGCKDCKDSRSCEGTRSNDCKARCILLTRFSARSPRSSVLRPSSLDSLVAEGGREDTTDPEARDE